MAYGSHSAPASRTHNPAGHKGGRVVAVNRGNVSRPLPRDRALVGVRGRRVNIDIQAPPPFMQIPPQYALGDSEDDLGQFGFSLGKIVKNVGKAVKKGVVDVGHGAGAVVTSKIGQGVLGTALAVSGIGAPGAALIFGATKGTGNLIKKGGNLKHFATGVAQGAVEGVVSVGAGKAVRAVAGKIRGRGASTATGAAKSAAQSALVDKIAGSALPGVRVTPNANDPSTWTDGPPPSVLQAEVASAGAQADAIARAQLAQSAAEAARAEAAQQTADLQAQLNAARQAANDAQAQQLQAQLAQAQAQADAATRAAQAAQSAAQATQTQAPAVDTSQLEALVKSAQAAAAAAQAAAAAPPTPQATQAVQQQTAAATDGVNDAAAGSATQDASVLGGLGNINPIFLIGGVALLAVVMSKKNRRTRGA